jgi:hypothetical protein
MDRKSFIYEPVINQIMAKVNQILQILDVSMVTLRYSYMIPKSRKLKNKNTFFINGNDGLEIIDADEIFRW